MFRIIILSFTLLFATIKVVAQSGSYDTLWKKVDVLINTQGKTKSALDLVDQIYRKAKKERNQAQVIKALVKKIEFQSEITEGQDQAITLLQNEIAMSTGPERSILYSLLAQAYFNYYSNNRYKLLSRTATNSAAGKDFTTWSFDDFHQQIAKNYQQSLQPAGLLQKTALTPFDPIITKGNARFLRPTLYDLLAHRALDYFSNEERDVTRPAYSFSFDKPQYFGTADELIRMSIQSRDSGSVHHKALLIIQQLLAFHKNDIKPDAFIDVDLVRLQLINQFGVMDNKDSLYIRALETIVNRYPNETATARAMYYLAAKHAERAAKYEPLKDTTNQYEYLKAEEVCLKALALPAESQGKIMCKELLETIRKKAITIQMEKVNLPGLAFRSSVSYKNLSLIYLRLIKLSDQQTLNFPFNYDEKFWKEEASLTPLRSWEQVLPASADHQVHRTEIKIDALPIGSYLVLASDGNRFDPATNYLTASLIHVSRISFVQNGLNYFVLDRETGKPLEKATVQLWNYQYDYTKRKNNFNKEIRIETDKNGRFSYSQASTNNAGSLMEFTYQTDHLFTTDQVNIYFRQYQDQQHQEAATAEKADANAYIFTDRAIYRPGQTVFFKSLLLTKEFETGRPKLLVGEKSTFSILDVNGQKIDSVQLETNDFGSCTGQFKIPTSLLSGTFRITNSTFQGEAGINVEEYKRPKFEVTLHNPDGVFKLGDSIKISGNAKAFAGNTLANVNVKYRVVRQARFIYFRNYSKRGFPATPPVEITNGLTKTDENGEFRISFNALPDRSIQPFLEPVFDYKIIADITDLNGETQSSELIVPVSYKALQLHIENFNGGTRLKNVLEQISISSQNLGGKFEPSKLDVSFYLLKAPQRRIRSRYWQAPDQFVMSREAFLKEFPLDEYESESDYKNWDISGQPVIFTDSARPNQLFKIDPTKIKSGWYRIEAVTHDRYGAEVKDIQYVRVIDRTEKESGSNEYFLKADGKSTLEPGSEFTTTIGSPAVDIYLIREIDTMKNIGYQDRVEANTSVDITRLNRELKTYHIPITEKERGGFGVSYFFVRDNRMFSSTSIVQVPWTNKELNISYESFRDKTTPGSTERWKLKVSGDGKDKLAAELLASMYDASLDQFTEHRWNKPDIWPVYGLNHNPSGLSNFSLVGSRENSPIRRSSGNFFLNYDQLISVLPNFDRIYLRNKASRSRYATESPEQMNKVVTGYDSNKKVASALESELAAPDTATFQSSNDKFDRPTLGVTAIKARSDFRETAFFLPQIYTDSSGNIEFSFTMPEALTSWKFQVLAHTKDASFGYSSREVVTQKELMVQPNPTRFLREGDHLEMTTKIANLSSREMTGTVHLQLFDAATMEPVDASYQNVNPNQHFTAAAGQSALASFPIQVPYVYGRALLYRFTASTKSGNDELSDGEEAILPVLTNSILVTETIALPMKGNNSRQFNFDKLLASGKSETLKNHALTVEFTTNPSWFALMSLPYLAETTFHCSERVFNQYYANAIAIMVANSSPKIRSVVESWKTDAQTGSNLQKNEDLKSVILQETPWLVEGLTDSLQKQNLAKLFGDAMMDESQAGTLAQLQKYQTPNGGFTWFDGGRDDRFITQYIMTGLGHLKKIGAGKSSPVLDQIMRQGLNYLDKRIAEDYAKLLKNKADLKTDQTGYGEIQYLYSRSFFSEFPVPASSKNAVNFYKAQAGKFWVTKNKFMQGMVALIMNRDKQSQIAINILRSLKENAIHNEELGTYWKDVRPGYYWYQAPVETQALLIEAFTEISRDNAFADDLRTWLLKQKQTTHWPSTKATADACYALLLKGTDWLGASRNVDITLGTKKISSSAQMTEAGTGYFKQTFPGNAVTADMGKINVTLLSNSDPQTNSAAWGAVYWQYFERAEKITSSGTGVQIVKKIFLEKNSDRGPILIAVKEGDAIKVGDKIKIRVEIKSDRDLEYVQLKDMRASSFEPVNVLSGYKWSGGLGYYEATGDVSTSFFFDRLPRGTHVFEYPLFAAQKGNFSNGITTVQCLYAPEFASHSEGIRINVE